MFDDIADLRAALDARDIRYDQITVTRDDGEYQAAKLYAEDDEVGLWSALLIVGVPGFRYTGDVDDPDAPHGFRPGWHVDGVQLRLDRFGYPGPQDEAELDAWIYWVEEDPDNEDGHSHLVRASESTDTTFIAAVA